MPGLVSHAVALGRCVRASHRRCDACVSSPARADSGQESGSFVHLHTFECNRARTTRAVDTRRVAPRYQDNGRADVRHRRGTESTGAANQANEATERRARSNVPLLNFLIAGPAALSRGESSALLSRDPESAERLARRRQLVKMTTGTPIRPGQKSDQTGRSCQCQPDEESVASLKFSERLSRVRI